MKFSSVETIVVPTVRTQPDTITDGASPEYGAGEPSDDNIGVFHPRLVGDIRDAATAPASIEITTESLGRLPQARSFDWVRAIVKRAGQRKLRFASVPRFGVVLDPTEEPPKTSGILPNFKAMTGDLAGIAPPTNSVWVDFSMVVYRDVLYLGVLYWNGTLQTLGLRIYSYDPEMQAVGYVTNMVDATSIVETAGGLIDNDDNMASLCLVEYHDALYAIVACNTRLFAFRWNRQAEAENALNYVSTLTPSGDHHFKSGVAAIATPRMLIVAAHSESTAGGVTTNSIYAMQSEDVENWSQADAPQITAVTACFPPNSTRGIKGDYNIRAISFSPLSTHVGWAVGEQVILKTINSGLSWFKQDFGYDVPNLLFSLHAVHAVSDTEVWACGKQGTVLSCTDGVNWKVFRAPQGMDVTTEAYTSDMQTAIANRTDILNKFIDDDLESIAVTDTGVVLFCGGKAVYAAHGISVHPTVDVTIRFSFQSGGSPHAVAAMSCPAASDRAIIVGGPMQESTDQSKRILVYSQLYSSYKKYLDVGDESGSTVDTPPTEKLFAVASGAGDGVTYPFYSWAVGERGTIIRIKETANNTFTVEDVKRSDGTRWATADLRAVIKISDSEVVVVGDGGVMLRSRNANAATVTDVVFYARQVGDDDLSAVRVASGTNYFVFGSNAGFYLREYTGESRKWPAMMLVGPEDVLMSVSNTNRGIIEFFRSTAGASFAIQDQTITTAGLDVNEFGGGLRTALFRTDEGAIGCAYADHGMMSLDEGVTWIAGDSPRLALPIGTMPESRSRRITTPFAGRLFSLAMGEVGGTDSAIYAYIARQWDEGATLMMPALSIPQYIGIDNLYVMWPGMPVVGDKWTFTKRFRYGGQNMALPSPTVVYRSADATGITAYWDRRAADAVAAYGNGNRWNVTGFFLFGTNFLRAYAYVTHPAYDVEGWPSAAAYIETFELSSRVGVWRISESVSGSSWNGCVVHCDTASGSGVMIPGEFAPGLHTFWAYCNTRAGKTVAKILSNTENSMILATSESIVADGVVTVFTDCAISLGNNGTVDLQSTTGVPWRYPRHIKLHVPSMAEDDAQAIADDYIQIGSHAFGTHLKLTAPSVTGAESDMRRGFSDGLEEQIIGYGSFDRGLSGAVSPAQHFGRPIRRWVASWRREHWDREQHRNPLMLKLFDPFVFVFSTYSDTDPHSAVKTARWVQFAEGPTYSHLVRNWADDRMELIEVP